MALSTPVEIGLTVAAVALAAVNGRGRRTATGSRAYAIGGAQPRQFSHGVVYVQQGVARGSGDHAARRGTAWALGLMLNSS